MLFRSDVLFAAGCFFVGAHGGVSDGMSIVSELAAASLDALPFWGNDLLEGSVWSAETRCGCCMLSAAEARSGGWLGCSLTGGGE